MKIKVRNGKYNRWSGEPIKFEEFEIECKGTGTKDDPVIIDSSSMFPKGNIDIIKSELHIIIENCDIELLTLRYSKNIAIRNCKFGSLVMVNCSDIIIEKTRSSWIRWFENRNCLLKDSVSEEQIRLYKCSNNVFKNCEFWNLFTFEEDYSRGNEFENCDFSGSLFGPSEEAFKIIQKPALKSKNTFSIGTYTRKKGYIIEEVECSGSGTKENPFIVDNQNIREHNLKKIRLFGIRDYVIFKNFDLKQLKLYDTQHMTIVSCTFSKSCLLKFCADINMNFISMKKLKFGACSDIIIANSDIKEIEVYEGYIPEGSKLKKINIYEGYGTITLRNCSYKKIKKNALNAIEIV